MTRKLSALPLALGLIAAGLAAPSRTEAHGRPPALLDVHYRPGQPDRLVAQATWGLIASDDGGGRWRWICSAAYGVDARAEDPPSALMGDGSLLLATYGGLRRSTDGGCSWEAPSEDLDDVFVIDLHRVDAMTALAVETDSIHSDRIHRTDDGGATWVPLAADLGEVLVDRVRNAPSDPMRLYASGAIPTDMVTPRRTFLLRSDDGGETFVPHELALETGERLLYLWAVDPSDADVVYGQVLHFNGELAPERIVRTEDGGETWETVLSIPRIGGILVREDGTVYAASRLGGLYRATDGRTFETLDDTLPVTCLSEDPGGLWACTDQRGPGYALARSTDGTVFTPALDLPDVDAPIPCPRCTQVGFVCPAWASDIAYDLGYPDAALPPGFDPDAGGTGAPRDASVPSECLPPTPDAGADAGAEPPPTPSCGCRAGRTRGTGLGWILALALGVVSRRRRSRLAAPTAR